MSDTLRIVYARRQLAEGLGEWFSVHTHYTPEKPREMYQQIAYRLSDGTPDEEVFDLAHAPVGQTPDVREDAEEGEDDWFDVAHADTGFGEVRVEFESHNTIYHLS